ncbi:MAG: 2-C-methyl-D-erythritol 4-phosphate cytidylyltransferase [Prevotella sp.]|jgi:2-C-methyl-D-erythritol 4-phosphate cytidylyltransferase|nr:2-C-methyl-D-erythritol 4-phosphate cytidylyltransferase [Prevotella sp.]
MKRKNVIIVAGGKGLRMGGDLPKQFIPLAGKPVLMRTIEAFFAYDNDINIVLALPLSRHAYWKELCAEYRFAIPHLVVAGGETRFHSVKNGLALVEGGIVGVQDGVRPFVSNEMIKRCFHAAITHRAVIPVIDSTDSLREMIDDEKSKIIDRSKIRLVQTPQVFHADVLQRAYETGFKDTFTDDASVVEAMGIDVHLVKGEVTNIKITTPLDLKTGELIIGSSL